MVNYERNEKGEMLCDIEEIAKGALEDFSRYNGGWIKAISGIDKSVVTGYSIVGEFCNRGLAWHAPGLYLDCSKDGSRKNQYWTYTVFRLNADETVEILGDAYQAGPGGDWAPQLWKYIEAGLEAPEDRRATLEARREALLADLDSIETELRSLSPI